ncbi:MAG: T9SS type A sorting domain-containing protein [Ferruginibacter sp.]
MKKSIVSIQLFISILSLLIVFPIILPAQSVTPFSIWKQVTQRGDITFTGNSTLTCNAGGTCATAQAEIAPGGTRNNNSYTMVYNNIADATDPVSRFSRTNANLTLGTTGGCGVIHALLFWGGNIDGATPNQAKRDSVYLRTPVGGYTGLKADILTNSSIPFGGYYCYKDVTSLIRQGGSGTYWLANQVTQTNATGLCGAWTLVVIYNDPVLPLRNLTIFRGISSINGSNPQNIPISGFYTPPSPAPVNIKLGVFSMEGDRGITGDALSFNTIPVSDAKHPSNNSFNSTITNNTAEIIRNPAFPNTLGINEDIFVPDNSTYTYLANGASNATLRMTSTGDVYAPYIISTAIDVFEPLIEITKEVADLNGGLVELGDTLKYSLKVVNRGNDPATNVVLHDSLYGAMNYVPNSLKINSGANTGVKTDLSGDDQADFSLIGGINFAKFRLGSGANATTGGNMGITAATDSLSTVEFKVTVTTDCQIFRCNSNLENKAFVTFVGNISGEGRSTYSSPSGLDPYGCPALGPTTLVVNVPPCTPIADTSMAGCPPFQLSNILPYRPGFDEYFDNAWNPLTEATVSGVYYAVKQLYPGCNDTIQLNLNLSCTLPIQLSYFNGSLIDDAVTLNWKIETESNFSHFEIERSTDGNQFNSLGSLFLTNSSLYNFKDQNLPSSPILYYRLKMIDRDGRFSYSQVIIIRKNNKTDFIKVQPNPVTTLATVNFQTSYRGDAYLTIINAVGQQVERNMIKVLSDVNSIGLDMTDFKSGMYMLYLVDHSGAKIGEVQKLIKN